MRFLPGEKAGFHEFDHFLRWAPGRNRIQEPIQGFDLEGHADDRIDPKTDFPKSSLEQLSDAVL